MKILVLRPVVAVVSFACSCGWACAEMRFDVSPGGEFPTPGAAVAKVAEMRRSGGLAANETAVIRIGAGTYELPDTLEVSGKDLGPVRFVGEGAERSVVSGGRKLGPFTEGPGGIWHCKVPEELVFEQLWINGRRAQCAKAPNDFYYYIRGEASRKIIEKLGGRHAFVADDFAFDCLDRTPADEIGDVMIHVYWAWDDDKRTIGRYHRKSGTIVLKTPVGRDFLQWRWWCPRFTIENCRAALDAPGEWFLDRRKSEILYIPLPGEKASETTALAPALKTILSVHDVKDVSFENIRFACNGWRVGKGLFSRQSGAETDAAIRIRDARNIHFRNCEIVHTADYGIWFEEGVYDSSIRHSYLHDLGGGGARIGERWWNAHDRVSARVVVDDNIITDGGHVFPAGTGVYLTYATDCEITHNDISDLYYSGVCCGYIWGFSNSPSRRHKINWNHIHHLGKGVMSDMGFIYTLGNNAGTVIAGNHGHDMFSYGYTGSGGTGLYPDEGSNEELWTSNLIHHTKTSALSMNYGTKCTFVNNIFAFPSKPRASVAGRWTPKSERGLALAVTNNIFVWSSPCAGWHGEPEGAPATVADLAFGKNLWWSIDGVKANDFNGGSWEQWQRSGQDAGSVVADPQFVDWKNGDWRLRPESPAFKLGFKEWDYTLAGVRKEDPAWRARADGIRAREYKTAPVPPEQPGRRFYFADMDKDRPGSRPRFFSAASNRQCGFFQVSTNAAFSGKQSLEIRDFAGLKARNRPFGHILVTPYSEHFQLRYRIKCDAKADIFNEWRQQKSPVDADSPYVTGLLLRVKDGKMTYHGNREVAFANYRPGEWTEVVFDLHLPKSGKSSLDITVTNASGGSQKAESLYFFKDDFVKPTGVWFISNADADTVTYLDDFGWENF